MTPKQAYLEHFFRDLVPGEFPLRVSAETTNHCNLSCDYCPREDSGRGFGHMSLELFDALADQCAHREIGFSPQGFGEPFADARFGDLLRRARARGVKYLDVTSNGTLLTEENCRALIEAPAALISIELDGADPAVFEASRKGASYAEVVENVRRLLRMREEARSVFPYVCLSVLRLPEVLPTLPAFYALWKPLLRPTDEIFEALPATWTGDRPMPGKRAATEAELRTRPPCRHLYKTLQVYYDGRTSPCTYDHACRLQVGDASRESLLDIWNGAPLRRLRELHESGRSGELDVCRGCPDHLA